MYAIRVSLADFHFVFVSLDEKGKKFKRKKEYPSMAISVVPEDLNNIANNGIK